MRLHVDAKLYLAVGAVRTAPNAWIFYSQHGKVIIKAQDDLVNQLLQLCDGTRHESEIILTLQMASEEFERDDIIRLLESLKNNHILVEPDHIYEAVLDYFYPGCQFEKLVGQDEVDRIWAAKSLPDLVGGQIILASLEKNYLGAIAATRRTSYNFKPEKLRQGQIFTLLWLMYGKQSSYDARLSEHSLTVPSGGGLYGLRIDIFVRYPIDGIQPGHYLWRPLEGGLQLLTLGDQEEFIGRFFNPLMDINHAAGVLTVSADLRRLSAKYGNKSVALAYLEAGHVMQNAYLAASMMNIGFAEILGIDRDSIKKKIEYAGCEYFTLIGGIFGAR